MNHQLHNNACTLLFEAAYRHRGFFFFLRPPLQSVTNLCGMDAVLALSGVNLSPASRKKNTHICEGVVRLHPHLAAQGSDGDDDRRQSAARLRAKPGGLFVSFVLYASTIKLLIAELHGRARMGDVSLVTTRGSPIDQPPTDIQ